MEIYVVNSSSAVVREGAKLLVAVFTDKVKAEETVARLKQLEEETGRKSWGKGWYMFATNYTLETHEVNNDVQSVVEQFFPEGS